MKTSEQLDKIVPALLAAQKLIDHVVKDQTGKIVSKTGASYEYKYSNLASVLEEVKGPLNDNGIIILQAPAADANGVTVTTRLLHESTQWIEETLFMPIGMNSPQAYGAAISYARRYALQSMVGLKAEDDDAQDKTKRRPNTARQVAVDSLESMSPDEQQFLRDMAMEIIAEHDSGKDVHGFIEAKKLDNEEKLALWSLLPAPVRSALKRAPSPSEFGSQP